MIDSEHHTVSPRWRSSSRGRRWWYFLALLPGLLLGFAGGDFAAEATGRSAPHGLPPVPMEYPAVLPVVTAALGALLLTLAALCLWLWQQLRRRTAGLEHLRREMTDNQARYRELVELAADGILLGDPGATIIAANATVCAFFGVTADELIGKVIAELPWEPENLKERPFRFDLVNAGQTVTNYRTIRRRDGSLCYIEMRSKRMPDGYYHAFLRDVTDRQLKEQALLANEENLRGTLDSIGEGVIATDTGGRVLRMNPVAEFLTGWTMEEAAGKPLDEILLLRAPDTRQPLPGNDNAGDAGSGTAHHALLLSREGTEYRIDKTSSPIRNSEGIVIGRVLVFRDITEEHALQEQLRHSQKLDAIGQLAGGVAHDFNNMLGGIMAATDLLSSCLAHPDKAQKYLKIILDSAQRAADLTEKLLAFSRKQPTTATVIDAHIPLRDTISLLENTSDRRVRIRADLAAERSLVAGAPSHLQSAFLNLGINAVQAMPGGGTLDILTRLTDLDAAYCRASSFDLVPGVYLDIEFRDTGTGISPENLHRIFDPFFTTKEPGQGTGLGLSAVLGTIQQHQGAITVYSVAGAGTSFHVLLPLADDNAPAAPQPDNVRVPGTGRILLVDDEEVMRASGQAILEELGYEVDVAADGLEGLERFSETPDRYDLVILDMIMPQMNGKDCFLGMRAIRGDIRVVFSSGFSRQEDLDAAISEGISGFIRKPFRSAALSRLVHDAITGKPPADH